MSSQNLLAYKSLLKPGIIKSNTFAAVAGYFFAAALHPDWMELAGLIAGIALIIASACVFNNYFDREMDAAMERTKNRPLASGEISGKSALEFATIILILGAGTMALHTNLLALGFGMLGFIAYVFIYTPIKKRSVHGTLVGSIPGATPPIAGYVAFTGQFDVVALLLGLILIFWQMPHFFAIALFRLKDYQKAGVPVLPVVEGTKITKIFTMLYIIGLIWSCVLLTVMGYAGWTFLVVMTALSGIWLLKGALNYRKLDAIAWGKKMFIFSIPVIAGLSLMIALANILP